MRRLLMAFGLAAPAAACGSAAEPGRPAPELAVLIDVNPDPRIVEVELIAAPATVELLAGKPADVWAFRDGSDPDAAGSIPGPMLEAKLGDQVIVHFRNDLPDETTIHWHGLRVPNAADGTPASQVPVPPGGTYDYEMTLVDAGLYWYHPHVAGDVQIERGLYAPVLVHGGVDPDVAADRVFVLDDVKVEASGQLSTQTDVLDLMLGRQGNVVLVNGQRAPGITAAAGSRERWRFVSSANGRYFQLELPGGVFRVIGWDGGLVDAPYETQRLLIAPGERYDVLVELAGNDGDELALRTVHYDRGHDIPDPGPIDVLAIRLGPASAPPDELPLTWGDVAPIPTSATTPRRAFVLAEDDTDPANPVFTINDEAYPNVTPVAVSSGEVEIWEIENTSEMDHPFHLHGMSFQVLALDGTPTAPLGWKDTVNVPRETTLRFAVAFGGPGVWMYHCHILEHAERGMMGELEVSAPP
jgi:FtsP/CotA-like multicopper oxidase with cupredoxin domain